MNSLAKFYSKYPWIIFVAAGVILGLWLIFKPGLAPLQTSFRRSSLDADGLVLQVRNTSVEDLSCRMVAVNQTVQQKADYAFSLGSYKSTEIGILEAGWSFKSGETVNIWVEGYSSPVKIAVP